MTDLIPSREKRDAIVQEARELLREQVPNMAVSPGACLYNAWAIIVAAAKHDIPLRLYGGTTIWECMTPENDDGVSAQQFGYVWEEGPHNLNLNGILLARVSGPNVQELSAGRMPEMHIWAGAENSDIIVDLSTKDWPAQTRLIIGRPWLAPQPPDYFWDRRAKLPRGTVFQAHPVATRVALMLLENST
jgi:hypothetical protein